MIWINWMQQGAMIGFWVVGFFLIIALFLPAFAILFALIGKLLSGFRSDDDDDECWIEVPEEGEEEQTDGDDETDEPGKEA